MIMLEKHNNIIFDEPKHTYQNKLTKQYYTSVTTFLGQYHEEFDAENIASRISKGCNITKGKLKLDWIVSAPIGSYIHYLLELFIIDYLEGKDFENNFVYYLSKIDQEYKHQFNEGVKLFKRYLDKGWEVLKPELIIYSDKYNLCGTADLVMINENHDIAILDWKTSNSIPKKGYGDKFYTPISNLDDCKFNKYSLQLNIYKRMIEDYSRSLEVKEMALLWIGKDKPGKVLKVEDMSKQITRILK